MNSVNAGRPEYQLLVGGLGVDGRGCTREYEELYAPPVLAGAALDVEAAVA